MQLITRVMLAATMFWFDLETFHAGVKVCLQDNGPRYSAIHLLSSNNVFLVVYPIYYLGFALSETIFPRSTHLSVLILHRVAVVHFMEKNLSLNMLINVHTP